MKETLEQIRREALAALNETKTAADLEALRVRYLGKKGELTALLKQMGRLSAEERPVMGQLANEVREALTEALARQQTVLEAAALHARLEAETLDVTIPGTPVCRTSSARFCKQLKREFYSLFSQRSGGKRNG